MLLLEIHSSTESSPIKAQKISLLIKLHAINMQLDQNWTPAQRPQETILNKNRFKKTKIYVETLLNRNSLRIEAKEINLLPRNTSPQPKSVSEQTYVCVCVCVCVCECVCVCGWVCVRLCKISLYWFILEGRFFPSFQSFQFLYCIKRNLYVYFQKSYEEKITWWNNFQ